jgi:hypothetical protein
MHTDTDVEVTLLGTLGFGAMLEATNHVYVWRQL